MEHKQENHADTGKFEVMRSRSSSSSSSSSPPQTPPSTPARSSTPSTPMSLDGSPPPQPLDDVKELAATLPEDPDAKPFDLNADGDIIPSAEASFYIDYMNGIPSIPADMYAFGSLNAAEAKADSQLGYSSAGLERAKRACEMKFHVVLKYHTEVLLMINKLMQAIQELREQNARRLVYGTKHDDQKAAKATYQAEVRRLNEERRAAKRRLFESMH